MQNLTHRACFHAKQKIAPSNSGIKHREGLPGRMTPFRVHLTGGSGPGTSTLARALADHWSVPAFDTDDFFWPPTDPPPVAKRDPARRIALMETLFLPRRTSILTGSLIGWGDALTRQVALLVFLRLDPAIRLARLPSREANRFGTGHIGPGGADHKADAAFMDWARSHDDPGFAGRNQRGHLAGLAGLERALGASGQRLARRDAGRASHRIAVTATRPDPGPNPLDAIPRLHYPPGQWLGSSAG